MFDGALTAVASSSVLENSSYISVEQDAALRV
jgi:hypothetical protein